MNELYRWSIWGMPRYLLTLLLVSAGLICLCIFIRARVPLFPSVDNINNNTVEKPSWWQSFFLAFWTTLVACCALTWISSLWHPASVKDPFNNLSVLVNLCGAALILALTFAFEGIEIAFTDLRDKDPHQIEVAPDLVDRVRGLKSSFYEAREWAIIILVVFATLMIECDAYEIPYFAHVGNTDHGVGRLVRIGISLILTTFPFVWFAQSPGKALARRNSVAFIGYWATQTLSKILMLIHKATRFMGLEYPSEEASGLALRLLKDCATERNLPPSEFSFFGDGLRRYGAGFLLAHDEVHISDSGACTFTSSTLSYLSLPQQSVRRYFEYEKPFVPGLADKLTDPFSSYCSYWVFEAPVLGERITQDHTKLWNSLMYAEDPAQWSGGNYVRVEDPAFQVRATISASNEPGIAERLDVTLNFLRDLPTKSANHGGTTAIIILMKIKGATQDGTVTLPCQMGGSEDYPFFKKYALPCLRSVNEMHLDPNGGFRFAYPSTLSVTYENVFQTEEKERFFLSQKRVDADTAVPKNSEDVEKIIFCVDSPLPAGQYEYTMHIQRR